MIESVRAGDTFRMIIGEGLRLSLTGVALGLAGVVWLGRAISSLLFGVTATDPLTSGCLAAAHHRCRRGLLFPARRAMKLDPIRAPRTT